jgi:hypothetical protein
MNKIDFTDDDLSIQKFPGEGLIDDDYEITTIVGLGLSEDGEGL